MAKNGTEFSKYATTFFEIIDGAKSGRATFVKDLLKMGLTDEDKDYLDDFFPTVNNSNGQRSIEKRKADTLRKYFRGDNDISGIVSNLETEFDLEFCERYSEELQDYEDSKLIEFARRYHLNVNENNIDDVSKAIAEYYSSIIKRAATKKGTKSKKSNDKLKSNGNSISLSYTITVSEKKALLNLCELIKKVLRDLKYQTDTICKKQHELINLTDSEADKRWKPHLVYEIELLKNHFDESYPELEKLFAHTVELLEPKKDIHPTFSTFISIANNISSNEYRITCQDKFNYRTFSYMVSRFNDNYDKLLRDINKL